MLLSSHDCGSGILATTSGICITICNIIWCLYIYKGHYQSVSRCPLQYLLHYIYYLSFPLGLDIHRPVIYQHSKKLLCNLTVVLACRDDYRAACEARLTQHEMLLHSPSLLSLTSYEGGGDLQRCGSLNSLEGKDGIGQTSLAKNARELIKYISVR